MRVVVVLLAVLGVAFFAAMVLGRGKDDCRPPFSSGARSLGQKDCATPSWTSALSRLTDLFAPEVELSQKRFDVDATHSKRIAVPPSTKSVRIAKFALVAGDGVIIVYECRSSTRNCPSVLCIYKSTPRVCPAGNSQAREAREDGRVAIFDDGGDLTFGAARGPASVELK
jgi:hypothetical protein